MNKAIILLISTVFILIFMSFTSAEIDITGTWKAQEMENSAIKIYKVKDGYFYGEIIDSDKKEWINEIILKKVKHYPNEKVWKGEIYNIERDATMAVTIDLLSENKLKLVGKKSFMTKTFYWTKLK